MIKTILVPLDGSPLAEQGLTAACRLAAETGASLLLVRAMQYFGGDDVLFLPGGEHVAQVEERRAVLEARAYLDRLQRELTGQQLAARSLLLPSDPVRAILFAAETEDVDLISICTHGSSSLARVLVGSVADAVLRRSTLPVLLTRASVHPDPWRPVPFERILVPLDGTPFAEAALSYLQREGIGRDALLHLVRIVEPSGVPFLPSAAEDAGADLASAERDAALTMSEREIEARRLEAEEYLRTVGAARLQGRRWEAGVVIGDAGEAILRGAERGKADLIAVATHGRRGWDRLLHGSVTRHLLHHATVPLLILRGAESAPAGKDESAAHEEAGAATSAAVG